MECAWRPIIWTNQSLFSAWLTIKFLQQRRYLGFDNASARFGDLFRWPLLLLDWGTMLCMLAVCAGLIIFGWAAQWQ